MLVELTIHGRRGGLVGTVQVNADQQGWLGRSLALP